MPAASEATSISEKRDDEIQCLANHLLLNHRRVVTSNTIYVFNL